MAQNQNNIRIYGYTGTALYLAPKGTTLPTDLTTAPSATFTDQGWLGPEGISEKIDKDVKDFFALQGGAKVKRIVNKPDLLFDWYCLEETAAVLGLKYAGQTFTKVGTGGTAYGELNFMTNQTAVNELAMVMDLVADDGTKKRYVSSSLSVIYKDTVKLAVFDDVPALKFEGSVLAGAVNVLRTNSVGVMAALP